MRLFWRIMEGEVTDEAAAAAAAAAATTIDDAAAAAAAGTGEETVDFGPSVPPEAQAKLNLVLKKEREKQQAKLKKQTEDNILQLQELKKNASLTQKEKSQLEERISELSRSIMTKDQLANEERTKLLKKYDEDIKTVTLERDKWQNLFRTTEIERSIVDAAAEAQAFNPGDIIALLKPHTDMVEEVDKVGTKTGRLIPKVKFPDVDTEGNQVTLDLTVPEVVKRMTEVERYGHLFKTTAKGGLGMDGSTQGGVGTLDPSKMSPEEYKKHRNKFLK